MNLYLQHHKAIQRSYLIMGDGYRALALEVDPDMTDEDIEAPFVNQPNPYRAKRNGGGYKPLAQTTCKMFTTILNNGGYRKPDGSAYTSSSTLGTVFKHGAAKPWYAGCGLREDGVVLWFVVEDVDGELGTSPLGSKNCWADSRFEDRQVVDWLGAGGPELPMGPEDLLVPLAEFEEAVNPKAATVVPDVTARGKKQKEKRAAKRKQQQEEEEGGGGGGGGGHRKKSKKG